MNVPLPLTSSFNLGLGVEVRGVRGGCIQQIPYKYGYYMATSVHYYIIIVTPNAERGREPESEGCLCADSKT